jgi:hypothetical protein
MIVELDRKFPIEISDKIYRSYHKSIMREIDEILTQKIVWVLVKGDDGEYHLSFLICEGQKTVKFPNIFDIL